MDATKTKLISFVAGLALLLILLGIALNKECLGEPLAGIYPALFALASAAFAAIIIGNIEYNSKIISAGGPFVIFVILILLKPITVDSCNEFTSSTMTNVKARELLLNYHRILRSNDYRELTKIFSFPMHNFYEDEKATFAKVESILIRDHNERKIKTTIDINSIDTRNTTDGNHAILYDFLQVSETRGNKLKSRDTVQVSEEIGVNPSGKIYYIKQIDR
ncbi:hypothetical protein [Neolewinella persica]|uniref:hypothetical protein n=1 Tax=Neolewinella persica TaxID=70998 RepID=UPI000370A96F|nr:hypothetical protein [Neolewinella persica]